MSQHDEPPINPEAPHAPNTPSLDDLDVEEPTVIDETEGTDTLEPPD